MSKTFYLTTTLPYVNAPLHMGHALEFVRADTIARYKKLLGFDVYFNTGTDEHGMKIFEKAKEQGILVQDFVDQGFITFKEQLKMFGVTEDIHFIRTTDPNHIKAVEVFWKKVSDNGYIYKKQYEAKYCIGCESEKTDSELVLDKCPLHPNLELKLINEENYFFKYSEFGDRLLEFYEKNPNFVVPDFRLNEIKNFVKGGLRDFSISRLKEKMPWGISVPGDESQVMYVWFDALVNYISTLGWPDSPLLVEEGCLKGGVVINSELPPPTPSLKRRGENSESLFEKYWVNGNPTQYCGKDNTRFQAAMWQAMLIAAGVPNSHQIVVNGFITAEGGVRMSKSLGNGVDPKDIVSEYGTDALRYFLLREVGSFEDSPFTLERFKDAYNSGLANGLGNLVSRLMNMVVSYNIDVSNIQSNKNYESIYIETFDLKAEMDFIFTKIQNIDKFIQINEPFKKIKIDVEGAKKNLIYAVEELFNIAMRLRPLLPETAEKIIRLIKENKKPEEPLFLRKD